MPSREKLWYASLSGPSGAMLSTAHGELVSIVTPSGNPQRTQHNALASATTRSAASISRCRADRALAIVAREKPAFILTTILDGFVGSERHGAQSRESVPHAVARQRILMTKLAWLRLLGVLLAMLPPLASANSLRFFEIGRAHV